MSETVFGSHNGKKYTFNEMTLLLKDEKNKEVISEIIYHRLFDRFLKIFTYKPLNASEYNDYKSGFAIMTNCILLIETMSGFLNGHDRITTKGDYAFNEVFKKAKLYCNKLAIFENESIYKNVRCGLLHQGETYGGFKIRRRDDLFNKVENSINANYFLNELILFLNSYRSELKSARWDSEIWSRCRDKVNHIISN